MRVYEEILQGLDRGETLPEDMPERLWRYNQMRRELFDRIRQFNESDQKDTIVILENIVSDDKMKYVQESAPYVFTRQTILLVPGMYLRHLPEIDFLIELQANQETTVRRKIERDKQRNYSRDPAVTRRMVYDVEHPITEKRQEQFPMRKGLILDMNDFESIYIKKVI